MKKKFLFSLLLVTGLILASCGGRAQPTEVDARPSPTPRQLPPERSEVEQLSTQVAELTEGMESLRREAASDDGEEASASKPDADQSSGETVQESDGAPSFSVSGVASEVDPSVVLQAEGEDEFGNVFENTLGLGTEMMLAEDGSILVGPDFHDPEMVNESPHMDWISPVTQDTLRDPVEENFNAAEGAFLWFTGATVTAEVRGFTVHLEGREGHNWFLMIRGLFADGEQDSDRNSTVTFTDYVAGHAQAMLYPPGAYISEGNFVQVAESSHTDSRNCGAEGCSELSVFMLDLNTGAWLVVHQPQLNAEWEFVSSNWR